MHEKLLLVGFLFIFLGVFLVIAASILSGSNKTEGGFIISIGPFPVIGGATSKNILYFLMIMNFLLFMVILFLNKNLLY